MVVYCVPIDPIKDDDSSNAAFGIWQLLKNDGHKICSFKHLVSLKSKGLMSCSCNAWMHYTWCKHAFLYALKRKIIDGYPEVHDPQDDKKPFDKGPCCGSKIHHGRKVALMHDQAEDHPQESQQQKQKSMSLDALVEVYTMHSDDDVDPATDSEDEEPFTTETDKTNAAPATSNDEDDDDNDNDNNDEDKTDHDANNSDINESMDEEGNSGHDSDGDKKLLPGTTQITFLKGLGFMLV
jgi:hypothetical protein